MARIVVNGQLFETRNNTYGYYDGEPCNIVEFRGDYDAWRGNDTVILQAQALGNGWTRYWLSSTDAAERESLADIARSYF